MEAALKIRLQAEEMQRAMKEVGEFGVKLHTTVKPKPKPRGEKIKSFEYEKWDKFNVESALEDVENTNEYLPLPQKPTAAVVEESLFQKEKGNAYFSKGKFKKAIQCYSLSINSDPNAITPVLNRAMSYIKLEKYSDAINDCNIALKLDPKSIKGYWRRGICFRELKQYEESRKDLERALVFEPRNESIKNDLKVLDLNTSKGNELGKRRRISITEINRPISNSQSKALTSNSNSKLLTEESIHKVKAVVATNSNTLRSNDELLEKLKCNPPGTLQEFEREWKSFKTNPTGRISLLKILSTYNLSVFFKDSLNVSFLAEILEIFTEKMHEEAWGAKFFNSLQLVPRFNLVSKMLSANNKNILKSLLV